MIQPNQLPGTSTPVVEFAAAEARPDFTPNGSLPRHRWYRFKEGYSAGLVASFTKEFLPASGGHLLDPFLGSGTTAVEGARLGHTVVGVETNPFMKFLAEVKTRNYTSIGDLDGMALRCLANRKVDEAFRLPNDTTLVERAGLEKWLLNRSVARRFEEIRSGIATIRTAALRELLTLALVACVEDVANARKDGKCWRYRTGWASMRFDRAALDNAFASQVIRFAEDIEKLPSLRGASTVLHGDARECGDQLGKVDIQFDGLLTSPPYLNSFDYTDIYRPEVLLMHAARNSTELRKIRFKTLRSHVQVAWESSDALSIPLLREKIKAIGDAESWSGRIPDMVNAYFVDLDRVVEQCSRHLKVGAAAGFVVADSAYSGIVVPVDLILSEILERRGFETQKIALFRQTRGNGNHQQRSSERLREVMVVAEYRGGAKARSLYKSA